MASPDAPVAHATHAKTEPGRRKALDAHPTWRHVVYSFVAFLALAGALSGFVVERAETATARESNRAVEIAKEARELAKAAVEESRQRDADLRHDLAESLTEAKAATRQLNEKVDQVLLLLGGHRTQEPRR